MPIDFFALLIAVILVAAPSWVLGWHYGVRSFRNRNTAMMTAIEDNNRIYKEWADSEDGTNWEAGYQAGITATLNTLGGFIDKVSD